MLAAGVAVVVAGAISALGQGVKSDFFDKIAGAF